MNQQELFDLFEWACNELNHFEAVDCDESFHYYFHGEMVGGWAGDRRAYFFKHNDRLAQMIKMYDLMSD